MARATTVASEVGLDGAMLDSALDVDSSASQREMESLLQKDSTVLNADASLASETLADWVKSWQRNCDRRH